MEKCKIFLIGTTGNYDPEKVSEEVTKFLSDGKKKITRVLQSSAAWDTLTGLSDVGTHLTIFYEEE